MRNNLRNIAIGLALVAVDVLGALAGATSAGASEHCGSLSEGENWLPRGCYTLDVPEDVDVLRMTFAGAGSLNNGLCTFQATYPPGESDDSCAIPGPTAQRLTLFLYQGPGPVWVEFKEAQPVNIAESGWLWQPTDGAMFRFDGLEDAAVVSATGWPDVSLRVRRGAPPTRDDADCVSDASHGQFDLIVLEGAVTPGVESCRLDAGIGPLYAFVQFNRTFSACVELDGYPTNFYSCAERDLYGIGNGRPGPDLPPEYETVAEYETYAYSFLVSGVGA